MHNIRVLESRHDMTNNQPSDDGHATPDNTNETGTTGQKQDSFDRSSDLMTVCAAYARSGWQMIPLGCKGKRPILKDWPNRSTNDLSKIAGWISEYPNTNIGIETGVKSGLVIVDVDPRNGGDKHIDAYLASLNVSPGLRVLTGGGGIHYYFAHPGGYVPSRKAAPGIDLQADGGHQVVAPPSVHPSGTAYTWDPQSVAEARRRVGIADGDDHLLSDLLTVFPYQGVMGEKGKGNKGKPDRDGKRDDFVRANLDPIMSSCAWMRHCRDDAARLPEPEWYAMLGILAVCADGEKHALDLSKDHPGFNPDETIQKLKHAAVASPPRTCSSIRDELGCQSCAACPFGQRSRFSSTPATLGLTLKDRGRFLLTDLGNAERFSDRQAGKWIYCTEQDKWYEFGSTGYWRSDVLGSVQLAAHKVIREMLEEDSKDVQAHAIKSESADRISAMLRTARPMMAISTASFDRDHHKLMCANGVLELRSKCTLPGDPDDYITKNTGTEFDPSARSPIWDKFCQDLVCGDADLLDFIQRCMGYSLTGDISEKCFFIAQGPPDSGKSTFVNTITRVLGDYAMAADPDTFFDKQNRSSIRNDLAMLKDARLVMTSEIKKGERLSEDVVKRVTGGDPVRCRFLHKEYFEYIPTFKIWMLCNDLPFVRTGDKAIWTRIRVLPFHNIPKVIDRSLGQKLLQPENRRAILAWLVEGFGRYQERGLAVPARAAQAVNDYRLKLDRVAPWMDDCVVNKADCRASLSEVRTSYEMWCSHNGEEPVSNRVFNELLEEKGLIRLAGRVNGGYCRYWKDIAITEEGEKK